MDPDASVIVPMRDAASTVGRTLEAIQAQRDVELELIVADDGSRDGGAEIVRRLAPGATLLRGPFGGPGAARNAAVSAARSERLAFCDADCFPAPGWLARGTAALDRYDLCQGRIEPERPPGPFDRTIAVGGPHGLFEAANLFVRRDWFERVGGFEDWLGLDSGKGLGEDALFGWRLRRAGAHTGFEHRALAHHAVFARGPRGYIAEQARLRFFPELVAAIPELRDELLFGRLFLDRGTARFDLALAAVAAAAAVRPRSAAAAAALAGLGTAPWARSVARRAGRVGPRDRPALAAAELGASVVRCGALVAGSLRCGSAVL